MRRLMLAGSVLVVLGLPAGLVWSWIAEPSRWTYADGQLTMSEQAATGQFAVTGWFVVIGVVLCLTAGVVLDRLFWRIGWPVFVVAIVAGLLAGVVASQLGLLVGPPDPAAAEHLHNGQTVPMRLKVEGIPAYLAWGAAASLGALISVWFHPDDIDDEQVASDVSA